MRPIDADNLKEDLNQKVLGDCRYGEKIKSFAQWVIDGIIDNQPTIEPVKRGKWNPHEYGGQFWFKCSLCGNVVLLMKKHNYCHDCGAKMDQEV